MSKGEKATNILSLIGQVLFGTYFGLLTSDFCPKENPFHFIRGRTL
jgi:hypothetical protein